MSLLTNSFYNSNVDLDTLVDDSVWGDINLEPSNHTKSPLFSKLCNHRLSIKDIYGRVINIKLKNLVQMLTSIEHVSLPITETEARTSLKNLGIIIGRDGRIFIRHQNPIIESISGTKFWSYDLKKLKGAAASDQPRRFSDKSFKGIKLPLELFAEM
jgi:hypothetical protein